MFYSNQRLTKKKLRKEIEENYRHNSMQHDYHLDRIKELEKKVEFLEEYLGVVLDKQIKYVKKR